MELLVAYGVPIDAEPGSSLLADGEVVDDGSWDNAVQIGSGLRSAW
ncbi:hypothetical protein [Micromonospora sp. NBC_01813]|nr:hypothetical protein [Micromonospora sp. NBC_01813]WSA08501.1 hypothetical protein OG958_30695 [Micromonospora sp. NBC_01813]